jgi:chitodextrinase
MEWFGATDPESGLKEYRIWRGSSLVATVPVPAAGVSPSYTDVGLTPSTDYTYSVEAVNVVNLVSVKSPVVLTNTLAYGEAIPTVTGVNVVEQANHDVIVSWTPLAKPGITYSILRDDNGYNKKFIGTSQTSSFRDDTIPGRGTINDVAASRYTVVAYNGDGNCSTESSVVIIDAPVDASFPSPATNLRITAFTASTASLAWDPPAGAGGGTRYGIRLWNVDSGEYSPNYAGTACTIEHLQAGKTYLVSVTTMGRNGRYSQTAAEVSLTLPGASTAPTAPVVYLQRIDAAPTTVQLQWIDALDSESVVSYYIRRNGIQIGTTTVTPYANGETTDISPSHYADALPLTIRPGSTVLYDVCAEDRLGRRGPWSVAVPVVMPADTIPPAPPTSFHMRSRRATTVEMGWQASSTSGNEIERFAIMRGGVEIGSVPFGNGANEFVFADTGLDTGTYEYIVESVDWAGNRTPCSIPLSIRVEVDSSRPSTPASLIATGTSKAGTILSWQVSNDDRGIAGYDLRRDGKRIATVVGTSYADSGLSPGAMYVYQVLARDIFGNASIPSATLTVTTLADTVLPSVPSSLTTTAIHASGFTLAWASSTDDVGMAGYEVLRGGVVRALVTGTSFVEVGQPVATSAIYAVRAVDRAGNRSAVVSLTVVTLADTQAPSKPGMPTSTAITPVSIALSWIAASDNVGVVSYRLLRNGTPVVTQAGTTFTDVGLLPNTSYTYAVVAIDAAGNLSTASAAGSYTTTADALAPSVPTNLAAVPTDSTVALTWMPGVDEAAGSGIGSYDILRNGVKVGSSAGTSYTDVGLAPATLYTYTAKSLDRAGNTSPVSVAVVAVTRRDGTPPTAPVLTLSSSTPTSAVLSWTASTDNAAVLGYAIWKDGIYVAQTAGLTWADASRLPSSSAVYAVHAYDAAGNRSALSSALTVVTPGDSTAPTAPTALSSPTKTDRTVGLAWTVGSDAIGLAGTEILRNGVVIGLSKNAAFMDTGLIPSTAYSYAVRMKDLAGNVSASTAPLVVTTSADTVIPTAPPAVRRVSASWSAVALDWLAGADDLAVVAYNVYRNGALIGSSSTLAFTDATPLAGASVTYTVKSVDAAGNLSAASVGVVVATAADTAPPTAPTNVLIQTRAGTVVTIAWTAAIDGESGVLDYQVFKDATVVGTVTGTSFTYPALTVGVQASLTVKARDRALNASAASVPMVIKAGSDVTAPSAPTLLSSPTKTATSVSLSWTASTDNIAVTGYQVKRGALIVGRTTTAAFTDTGLKPGTAFTYTVLACDADVNVSIPSNSLAVTTIADTDSPTIPGGLLASSLTATGVTIAWTASTDANGIASYQLLKGGAVVATTTALSAVVTGLTPSTAYSFTVKAIDTAAKATVSSALAVSTPADSTVPVTPLKPIATATSLTSISLQWIGSYDDVGVTGYEVYRNATTKIATTNATTFTCVDVGLLPKTSNSYTVRCRDAAGNWSAASPVLTVSTVTDSTAPTLPSDLRITSVADRRVVLSWTASTDSQGAAISYQVLRSGVLQGTVTATTYTDTTGLLPNSSYAYSIKAIDAVLNVSAASLPLTLKTSLDPVVPTAPTIPAAGATTITGIPLTWTAATDDVALQGYYVYRGSLRAGYVTGTTFTDAGLNPATAYSYTLKAIDKAGNLSAASVSFSGTTKADAALPSTPGSLRVVSKTSSSVVLAWNASTDDSRVVGYVVYRNGSQVATPLGTTLTLTGLPSYWYYSFTVKSKDAANKLSNASSTLNVGAPTDVMPPSKPTGLFATAITYTSISLGWPPVADDFGVVGYQLYRNGSLIADQPGLSYIDTGVEPNNTYTYTLVAYDGGYGNSPISDPLVVSTLSDSVAPSAPENLSITSATITSLGISWDGATDVGGSGIGKYILSVNGVLSDLPASPLTASIPMPATGSSVTVILKAVDLAGNVSVASAPIVWTNLQDNLPPASPINVHVVSSTSSTLTLGWDAVADTSLAGYLIRGYGLTQSDAQLWSLSNEISITVPWSGSWLPDISVRARDRAGYESAWSAPTINVYLPPDATPPTPPTQVQFTALSPLAVRLTWVEGSDPGGGSDIRTEVNGNLYPAGTTSALISCIVPIQCTLKTRDSAGNYSSPASVIVSPEKDHIAPPRPSAPIIQSWGVGPDPYNQGERTKLIMELPTTADNGRITRYKVRAVDDLGEQMGTGWIDDGSVHRFNVEFYDLKGDDILFQVAAMDGEGLQSPWSDPVHFAALRTDDVVPPTAISTVGLIRSWWNSGTFAWLPASDTGSGVKKYEIFRNGVYRTYITANFTEMNLDLPTELKLQDASITFQVRAIDWAGNAGPLSAPVTVHPWLEEPPNNLRNVRLVGVQGDQLTYIWENPDRHVVGLSGYRAWVTYLDQPATVVKSMTLSSARAMTAEVKGFDASGNVTSPTPLPKLFGNTGSVLQRPTLVWDASLWNSSVDYQSIYLASIDVTRAWDVRAPGNGVPNIMPLGSLYVNAGASIEVQAAANGPVTFVSLGQSVFTNGRPVITVRADGTGKANALLQGATPTSVLAVSPACSGRLTFFVGQE